MSVCVVGSVNVDVILPVGTLPHGGETVLAWGAQRLPGGKGANQAVAAARMGASVRMVAAIGADEAGDWMRDTLASEGVDPAALQTDPALPTGAAYIAVDTAGENQIIVVSGANHALQPKDLPELRDGEIVLAQLETPLPTVAAALAAARGCRILNAAPALPEAVALFDAVDVLIVNQHELACYLSVPAVGDARAALQAAQLISRPGQVVVVTLGARGAVAVWRDRSFYAPALPVTPLDTIGAGDCFCGALAALLDEGLSLEVALPIANTAAALCTQTRGAAPAMPTRARVAEVTGTPTEYARAIKKREPAPLE